MKKTIQLLFFIISLFLFPSCGPLPLSRLGSGSGVTFSFVGTSSGLPSQSINNSRAVSIITPLGDEDYYKDEIKSENRGNLVGQFTPESFIISISDIRLYSANGNYGFFNTIDEILGNISTSDGAIIPAQYDLVNSRNIIRDFEASDYYWTGFTLATIMGYTNSNGVIVHGFLTVDLGAEYDGIMLTSESSIPEEYRVSGRHVFSNSFLSPYMASPMMIICGSDVATPGIQNPYGDEGVWAMPGSSTGGSETHLYYPSEPIDLTQFDKPEAVLYWNLQNLIEVYDNNTPLNPNDDIVTYNLSNPFPVELIFQELEVATVSPGDTVAPTEVKWPESTIVDSETVLSWINPIDEDFDHVIITKKNNVYPTSSTDGEVVYSGYHPAFVYEKSSSIYKFRISTVDLSGNISNGVVF